MKLIQPGKSSLLSKIKDFFVNVGRNCKLEFGLALIGIAWIACAEKYPDELSGGMCRRLSIARALAFGGDVFYFPAMSLPQCWHLTASSCTACLQ